MGRYRITAPAEQDLDDIWDFIADDNPEAARRLIADLVKKCQNLGDSPLIGRKRDDLYRDLRSFPHGRYVIFYRVVEGGVVILRIVASARNIDETFFN